MITLKKICVSFQKENQKKIFGKERQQVLFDVSLHIKKGSCMGILGESGSGKSTLGRIICGLLKADSGTVECGGAVSVVFQDYTTSANPRFTVKQIIEESLIVRERRERIRIDREKEISEYLKMVGLDDQYAGRFPHELSGGQLQRVCIARAVALKPKIILFDEAISSLDAHTQVQVMDLLTDMKDKLGLTYIFITHDLSSITYLCDEAAFLYQGRIVGSCSVAEIGKVTHPYAQKLLHAVVDIREQEAV